MTRKHIIFSGYVQGVGFRWRARKAAELHGCTGWVRNDWNGTVTMEGPPLIILLENRLAVNYGQ